MDIPSAKLQGAATEQDVRANFPDLTLESADRPSHFGDRSCNAQIASFNLETAVDRFEWLASDCFADGY